MMNMLKLKPDHKAVKAYYNELQQLSLLHARKEGAVSPAFANLLRACGKQFNWTLYEQYPLKHGDAHIYPDGALVDAFNLPYGYWEAKDSADDLEKEIKKKFEKGYPRTNILFQAPDRAILWQDGTQKLDCNLAQPDELVQILKAFFEYQPPAYEEWRQAVEAFKEEVPKIGQGILQQIEKERWQNPKFGQAFERFVTLCQESLNPNISIRAVEEMLIQHLLTERIFRKIFNNPDFVNLNLIASEIEKVIHALVFPHGGRHQFFKPLDRFYNAIETTAALISDFSQKQAFLNTVYEKFFQGFSIKVADTHGIVYTPQPVVKFMVNSIEEILQTEFDRSLSDEGVHILDPFVGTGNFIIHVMQKIRKTALPHKYAQELHCNEVMLLPYYIAAMNIEHEYMTLTGEYKPFEGICLVDTFQLAEPAGQTTFNFMTEENTSRVARQKKAPIFVILGNPPYNVGQVNENDNNKNRKYPTIDRRVAETYAKDSNATNKNALSDVYVKAFRWASDRIGDEGIVAFITNSGFVDGVAFDGMRKHLAQDFHRLYILDLQGNVRKDSMREGIPIGEQHTVFGLAAMVGISISFLIKNKKYPDRKIYYSTVDWKAKRQEKFALIEQAGTSSKLEWQEITPDKKYTWLTAGMSADFDTFMPMGTKEAKASRTQETQAIFKLFSNGVATSRDAWAYNFNLGDLQKNICRMIETYNQEIDRWTTRTKKEVSLDNFVLNDDKKIKWSSRLKECLLQGKKAEFSSEKIRNAVYRPFCFQYLFFDHILTHRQGQFPHIFPASPTENENRVIWLKIGSVWPMFALMVNHISDMLPQSGSQCFPFYTYDEDPSAGSGQAYNRRENITDWALQQFRERYETTPPAPSPDSGEGDQGGEVITKWDIFYYVYAVLHHPQYRAKYAANLKRELPRIPFVAASDKIPSWEGQGVGKKSLNQHEATEPTPIPSQEGNSKEDAEVFWAFAEAGKKLADLHVNYGQQPKYKLKFIEKEGEQLDWRVTKMKLSKDKTQLIYNDFLTLSGIPAEAFEYKLGNKSALHWVIDQYQVTTDSRSGIVNDPNRADQPDYIVSLIQRVITVSVETVKIINALPELVAAASAA